MSLSPTGAERLSLRFDRSAADVVVSLEGPLDLTESARFSRQVTAQIDRTVERVTLDVSKLTFCDFSGLDAIVSAGRHASSCGATFDLRRAGPALRELISVAGVADLLPLTA